MAYTGTTGDELNMTVKIYTIQQIKQQEKTNISDKKYKQFNQEWNRGKNEINPRIAIIMCAYIVLLLIFGIYIIIRATEGI